MFLSVTYRGLLNRNEKCYKIESRISDIIGKLLETLEEYDIFAGNGWSNSRFKIIVR